MASSAVIFLCLATLLGKSSSIEQFNSTVPDEKDCEETCRNTYPLHTYEKAVHLNYCLRGCRLFDIIDMVNDEDNLNTTRDGCVMSCKECHMDSDDRAACAVGCNGQLPFAIMRRKQLIVETPEVHSIYPLLYVHTLYSNMFDKMANHMSISWSYYMQNDNGQLMVVKSQPRYVMEYKIESGDEYKTSNYMETNLAIVDNSATPNLKHSQMHVMERELGANAASPEEQPADWLGCIAKKTGLPRILLSFTLFISAMMMIWLCFTTAATAPDQRIQPQKLSIFGDLEYLNEMEAKKLMSAIHPQDRVQASPLPIKIQVQRI